MPLPFFMPFVPFMSFQFRLLESPPTSGILTSTPQWSPLPFQAAGSFASGQRVSGFFGGIRVQIATAPQGFCGSMNSNGRVDSRAYTSMPLISLA